MLRYAVEDIEIFARRRGVKPDAAARQPIEALLDFVGPEGQRNWRKLDHIYRGGHETYQRTLLDAAYRTRAALVLVATVDLPHRSVSSFVVGRSPIPSRDVPGLTWDFQAEECSKMAKIWVRCVLPATADEDSIADTFLETQGVDTYTEVSAVRHVRISREACRADVSSTCNRTRNSTASPTAARFLRTRARTGFTAVQPNEAPACLFFCPQSSLPPELVRTLKFLIPASETSERVLENVALAGLSLQSGARSRGRRGLDGATQPLRCVPQRKFGTSHAFFLSMARCSRPLQTGGKNCRAQISAGREWTASAYTDGARGTQMFTLKLSFGPRPSVP